jgi:hypothetical protein
VSDEIAKADLTAKRWQIVVPIIAIIFTGGVTYFVNSFSSANELKTKVESLEKLFAAKQSLQDLQIRIEKLEKK